MSALRMMLGVGVVLAAAIGVSDAVSAREGPPSCGAVSFRPVAQGLADGTQDAGLYRSRFGKIVLHAEVKGGQAQNYYIEVNGKRPPPLQGALPTSVNSCLNAKHVKTPPPSAGANCVGSRFRVVLSHQAKAEYVMLFGLDGDVWKLCSASKM